MQVHVGILAYGTVGQGRCEGQGVFKVVYLGTVEATYYPTSVHV